MEYGRLVVLGYSSYRVATVQAPAPPRSDAGPPSSFGLGVAASAGTQVATNTPTNSPEGPVLGRTGSSSGSGRYSSSRKSLGQLWEPIGDQNAQFVLQRRKRANGVTLRRFHHVRRMGSTDVTTTAPAASVRSKDTEAVATRMMLAVERLRSEDRIAGTNQADNDASGADTTVFDTSFASTASTTSTASSSSRLLVDKPFLLCVPMNGSDPHASVTEYTLDPTTDMFQIGRLPCRQNDFVIPGPRVGASGTISRFAARLVCSREPPFQCRVFAGGFDAHRRATTAGHALKYCATCATWLKKVPLDHVCVASTRLSSRSRSSRSRSRTTAGDDDLEHVELALTDPSDVPIDGVTKNGVRVWLPEHQQWFEVSVNGNLYGIENRSAAAGASTRATVRHSTFNRPLSGSDGVPPVLTDGAIIDLGGVQLQFQTHHKLLADDASESNANDGDTERHTLSSVADQLERLNVQCPVQLHTLRFTHDDADGTALDPLETPHVFPACGHVFGFESRLATSRVCPLCRCPGFFVKLLLKENSHLQSAAERNVIPECVLNPCGHAISRKLAAHYATLVMPNGRAICPFCAAHLHPTTPFSRLFLYSEENETVVR